MIYYQTKFSITIDPVNQACSFHKQWGDVRLVQCKSELFYLFDNLLVACQVEFVDHPYDGQRVLRAGIPKGHGHETSGR